MTTSRLRARLSRALCGGTLVKALWQQHLCCSVAVNGTGSEEKSALAAFAAHIHKQMAAQP